MPATFSRRRMIAPMLSSSLMTCDTWSEVTFSPPYSASDTRRRASAVRARLRDRLFHRGSTTVSGQALDVVGLVGAALGHPPHRSGPGGLKPARDAAEQFGLGAACRERDAPPPRGLYDTGGNLDQAEPHRLELGARQRLQLGNGVAQSQQQPIGGGVQHEAHLIGERGAAAGAVGGKLGLVQFNQVLALPALEIESVENPPRAAASDVGAHVSNIGAVGAPLEARGPPPLAFPRGRAVAR